MTRPDLTLVHGWGMHHGIWSPCLDALRVVANVRLADLPGYGGTPDVNGAFADTARSLVAPIGETETGDRVTLCGWSLGALLAMQAALLEPERVEKLILVAATPRFTQQAEWNEAQPASLLDDFAAAVADDRDATLQRFAALFNQGDSHARAIRREIAHHVLSSPTPATATLLAGLDWLRDIDLRSQVVDISCPVLLIHGEHDPLMPVATARWLAAKLPRARLEFFPDAAHAPFLNDPKRFAHLVGDFLHAPRLD